MPAMRAMPVSLRPGPSPVAACASGCRRSRGSRRLRRTIRHLSHIFLTDARTFIALSAPQCDPSIRVSTSRPVLRDQDRVLEVRGQRAVRGHRGPLVVQQPHLAAARPSPSARSRRPSPAAGAARAPARRSSGSRAARAWRARCRGRRNRAPPRSPQPPPASAPVPDVREPVPRRHHLHRIVQRLPRDLAAAAASRRRSHRPAPSPPSLRGSRPLATPKSRLTMSPGRSSRGPGMPCTISSLTETQSTAG